MNDDDGVSVLRAGEIYFHKNTQSAVISSAFRKGSGTASTEGANWGLEASGGSSVFGVALDEAAAGPANELETATKFQSA
jgi:hypothetical protein